MLEDTEAAVLLTQERLIEKLPDHNATIRCLDRDWGEIAGESQDNPVPVNHGGQSRLCHLHFGVDGDPQRGTDHAS